MSTYPKKSGAAFWATLALLVALLYFASFGPASIKFALWRWVEFCGGEWMLADIVARRSFEPAPYRNVTGFEPGRK